MSSLEIERERLRRVFVRAPNWLGDVVMATPAFARLRAFFAGAELVCGVKRGHAPVLSGQAFFDRLLFVETPKGFTGLRREAARLRAEDFDLAFLFPNSLSSALVCALARIPRRVGYTQGRGLLMTQGLRARGRKRRDSKHYGPRREPIPMIDYWFTLCDALGMPEADPRPVLAVSEDERARAVVLLAALGVDAGDELLLVNPGASFGPSKLWEVERWAELADRLLAARAARRARVLVLAGPGEEELARSIARTSRLGAVAGVEPLVPLDILKAVVARADLLVATDSGTRHLAVAFETPHLVLMGPTHPGYTARNLERARVLRHEVDCGPCHLPRCPLDHACMLRIEVDEVAAASLELLDG